MRPGPPAGPRQKWQDPIRTWRNPEYGQKTREKAHGCLRETCGALEHGGYQRPDANQLNRGRGEYRNRGTNASARAGVGGARWAIGNQAQWGAGAWEPQLDKAQASISSGIIVWMKKTLHIDESLLREARSAPVPKRIQTRFDSASRRWSAAEPMNVFGHFAARSHTRAGFDGAVNEPQQPGILLHDRPGRHIGLDSFPVESSAARDRTGPPPEPRRSEWP